MALNDTWTAPTSPAVDLDTNDIIDETFFDDIAGDVLYLFRRRVVELTNNSGGQVVAGDVVVLDVTADASFSTTTTADNGRVLGVAAETILAGTLGKIITNGIANVNTGAATSRGDYLATSTTVKVAKPSGSPGPGDFAVALAAAGGSGLVSCLLKGAFPTPAVWQTGDLKTTMRVTADPGWIMAFGQTVNASLGQPAHALYVYANANSLIGAGKPFSGTEANFVMPDYRATTLVGPDTMGGSARNLIPALDAVGKTTGAATHVLTAAQMPSHAHDYTHGHGVNDGQHSHPPLPDANRFLCFLSGQGGSTGYGPGGDQGRTQSSTGSNGANLSVQDHNGNTGAQGSDNAHPIVQPSVAANIMIKL